MTVKELRELLAGLPDDWEIERRDYCEWVDADSHDLRIVKGGPIAEQICILLDRFQPGETVEQMTLRESREGALKAEQLAKLMKAIGLE